MPRPQRAARGRANRRGGPPASARRKLPPVRRPAAIGKPGPYLRIGAGARRGRGASFECCRCLPAAVRARPLTLGWNIRYVPPQDEKPVLPVLFVLPVPPPVFLTPVGPVYMPPVGPGL